MTKFSWPFAVRITCSDPGYLVEGGIHPGTYIDEEFGPVVTWFETRERCSSRVEVLEQDENIFSWVDNDGHIFRMIPMTVELWNTELALAREDRREFETNEGLMEFLKEQWSGW